MMRPSPLRRARGSFAHRLEALETRRLLAIVVDTTVDETVANATTSLREAIALAADNPGDDIITFDPTVFTAGSLHTITPASSPLTIDDSSGALSIEGPGPLVLAISGSNAGRGFYINSGNVTLSDLTIRDGVGMVEGGGIFNSGNLTLDNVTLTNNIVSGAAGTGDVELEPAGEGEEARGGAIYNEGNLTILASSITANAANGGAGGTALAGGGAGGSGFGGAIFSSGGVVTISGTNISGNAATGGSGGGSLGSGASAGGAFGGAIYFAPAVSATIINSPMTGNSASGGNGANAALSGSGGNGGAGEGGALWSDSNDVSIIDSSFSSNLAFAGNAGNAGVGGSAGAGGVARGAAIFNSGLITLSGGIVNSNTAFGGASNGLAGAALGGGIFNSSLLAVQNVQLISNAAFGAAAPFGFSGNGHGGAIYSSGPLTVTDALLTFNTAKSGDGNSPGTGMGGGIYTSGASVDITATTISFNSATGGAGGADLAGSAGGDAHGGGIRIQTGVVAVIESTIDHNAATGGAGGEGATGAGGNGGAGLGGGVSNSGTLKFANSTVYGNTAVGGAGGNGIIEGGDGGGSFGGGVFSNATGLTSINSTFASNQADSAAGGGIALPGAAGAAQGGGIYSTGANASLTNTIVADNTAATNFDDVGGLFVMVNSLITDASAATSADTGSADNIFGQSALLGPLGDNGGPTETALPDAASPAVDAGNNVAAIAEFGLDGNDQRGSGFPRFINTVDIGAVEVGIANISITGNGNVIVSGDDTPSVSDNTDFGSVFVGDPPVQRTFVVSNTGNLPLTIFDITIPDGFDLVEALESEIAAGDTDSFTIALSTTAEGVFTGNVIVVSNAPTTLYTFAIKGEVVEEPEPPPPPPPSSPGIHINFQTLGSQTPSGYLADAGLIFGNRGNGQSYGWNLGASSFTRDRNAISDQLRDTLTHMQLYGNRTWEIAVPNGTYRVHLVAGDPSYFDSTYRINIEGVLGVNGKPTSGSRFVEGTVTVRVSDGRLTISNAAGSINNKLNFIDITPVTAINFQTSGSATPAGYLADAGAVFGSRGNGFSYGWNATAASFARDRNAGLSPDQRYDTLIHSQLYGTRTWEIGVSNGTYEVRVVAGDPSYTDSVYRYNVEGILALSGTPTSGNRWIEGIVTVNVTDGKLSLTNASGAVNNKIAFIEFTKLA